LIDAESLLALNDTVSCFYDAALGRVSWEEPLGKCARFMQTKNALFSVRDPVTRKAHFSFGNFGTDMTFTRNFAEKYSQLSPFVIAAITSPEGTVVNPINLIGREAYERGRFFREWSAPQGYHDYMGSILLRQKNAIYTIALGRTTNQPLFNDVDEQKLELLIPHVTRALQISERLNTFETERAELLSTLDSLSTPVILIDRDSRIRQINTAAIALIESDQGIANRNGTLRILVPQIDHELRTAAPLMDGHGVILPSKLKNGMQIHVLAHDINPGRTSSSGRYERLLLVFDWPNARSTPIGENLRDRFGLTISELRVLMPLVDGGSVKSIAFDLGLSQETIRSHVKNLFQKTATNRQQDLIRVVLDHRGQIPIPIKSAKLLGGGKPAALQ
jgi:DNA-binding CsgD family transcriptional regulator